jgi:hypothetical protein
MDQQTIAGASFDHSPLTHEIESQIVSKCVDAYGLRLEDKSVVLVLRNVQGPHGMIKSLDVPLNLKFEIKPDDDKSVRAGFSKEHMRVRLSIMQKHVIDARGVPHVPFSTVYFDAYRGSIVHEIVHAVDYMSKKSKFVKQAATTRTRGLEKKTPEHDKAYHGSPTEIRAYIEEIIYILEQRGARLLDEASIGGKADSTKIALFIKAPPESLMIESIEAKLLPPKYKRFIENTTPRARLELVRRLRILQQSMKRRYSGSLGIMPG